MFPAAVPEARNSCSVYPYGASANWLVSAGACNLDPVVPSGPEKVTDDPQPPCAAAAGPPSDTQPVVTSRHIATTSGAISVLDLVSARDVVTPLLLPRPSVMPLPSRALACQPGANRVSLNPTLPAGKVQVNVEASASPRTEPRYRVAETSMLDAAVTVFAGEGFDRAKMETIAARAGTTKPTLYARFDSKENLFAAAVKREYDVRKERLF